MNTNDVDTLTTVLSTELSLKRRRLEANSATQAERIPILDSETDTEEEDKNHTGAVSLRDSYFPQKKTEWNAGK